MSKAKEISVTIQEYSFFVEAFNYFNEKLFFGKLGEPMITYQRRRGSRGVFITNSLTKRDDSNNKIHEIGINPDNFWGRTDTEILSTLVHEMVHLENRLFGKPGKGPYHNKHWVERMLRVGLTPSDTGKPNGKMTGRSVSHYVTRDGDFEKFVKRYIASGKFLSWESIEPAKKSSSSKKSKWKFQCPNECGEQTWGKESSQVGCWNCQVKMERVD